MQVVEPADLGQQPVIEESFAERNTALAARLGWGDGLTFEAATIADAAWLQGYWVGEGMGGDSGSGADILGSSLGGGVAGGVVFAPPAGSAGHTS